MRERGAETEKMAEKQQKEVEDLSSSKLTCLENCRSQKENLKSRAIAVAACFVAIFVTF